MPGWLHFLPTPTLCPCHSCSSEQLKLARDSSLSLACIGCTCGSLLPAVEGEAGGAIWRIAGAPAILPAPHQHQLPPRVLRKATAAVKAGCNTAACRVHGQQPDRRGTHTAANILPASAHTESDSFLRVAMPWLVLASSVCARTSSWGWPAHLMSLCPCCCPALAAPAMLPIVM